MAEVSKDKEPIGRECAEFNWFESQLMSDSIEVRFKWFGLSSDLKFKRFGCQWMCFKWFWLCVDLRFQWGGCQLIWDSSDLVVNQVEIQMIWLSIVLKFKWVGRQLMCDSNDFDCERQRIWSSNVLKFNWVGCQLMCDSNDFGCELMWDSNDLDFEGFEIQVSRWSTELRFKWLGCQLTCAWNFCLLSDVRFK